MKKSSKFLILFLFLFPAIAISQVNITIEVNWPNWSSENRVIFRDPSNIQIGASICNPAACFNGSGNNSYNNIGSPASYPGVAIGTGYSLLLQDTYGDGWNGTNPYVRVYQDGVQILETSLTGGTSTTVSFDIVANPIAFNQNLVLFEEFDGYIGYTTTGNTLRSQPNTGNPCLTLTTSSNTLTTPIPVGGTIDRAYLYWAHSGDTPDTQVTFEGNTITADRTYASAITNRNFYGSVSDVTTLVSGIPNVSTNVFNFSGLTIDTSSKYCNSATVMGGWSLLVFYTDLSLPASTINLYEGFHGESNSSSTYTLDGFFAIGASGSKTTALSWEGDQTLSNNEGLTVTTGLGTFPLVGDGDNTLVNANPFNSTIFDNTGGTTVNNTAAHGMDLDTYDVSSFIQPGESSVTTNIQSGQDFVILNAVVLKVPSNLITGFVFEDVNYGGGAGRNLATSSGVAISNATIELYNSGGTLIRTTTTDATGRYVFAGMANGAYSVRVVNGSVRSTRGGGTTCTTCIPIQTFRKNYLLSTLTEITDEVGGANPSGADPSAGTITGAQTIASVTILNEGVAGLDFGFNFNTIVNTNEDGQGSLEQFIVNSNNLDETGLNIVANSIFNPAAAEDTSIFMIPTTADPLGRTADSNFASGYFDITISNGNPLTPITGANTFIDGRTQTAYSGDTNTGTVGSGGTAVGTSANILPNFEQPEIQIYRPGGDVIRVQANNTTIRNVTVYANNNAGIRMESGSANVSNNILGVNAIGNAVGDIDSGVEIEGGTITIDGNYISDNTDQGIWVNGGTSTIIQNNHITINGNGACNDNITVQGGSGIVIQRNLIENAASLGIDADGISGNLNITENTITSSGQNGVNCSGNVENAGILIDGNNSSITNNIIASNGGPGLVLAGGNTSGNLISQNSFYANGTASAALGIDLDASDNIGDGVTLNDLGDSDNGPNGAVNFPIISGAYASGANLVIEGWSRPGAIIELFLTDINEGTASAGDNQLGQSTDYGEGQVYIASLTEGSGADSDSSSSIYTDADGNTDNTNKFKFSIPMPPGVTLGEFLTSTATITNSTSEFSPMSEVKAYTLITNRRITYRVKKN